MSIQIKSRHTGQVILEVQQESLQGANLRGANLQRAYLSEADLEGANLSEADLRWANLSEANLQGTDLSEADLSGAFMGKANLSKANLWEANLSEANLRDADLSDADLGGANLWKADLRNTNLQKTNLIGANISRADFNGANLQNIDQDFADRLSILPEGDLIVWKRFRDGLLGKLLIPSTARRSNSFGRKCRAEFAQVLEIIGGDVGQSIYKTGFFYRVGEIVICDSWCEDRWTECGGGIHFYITRSEAENSI